MNSFEPYMLVVVAIAALIGLCIGLIIRKIKNRKAENYLQSTPGAAIVFLHKTRIANNDWADANHIVSIDGQKAFPFVYKLGQTACYVKPGERTLTVKSTWSRSKGGAIHTQSTQPQAIRVRVKTGGRYSLEYHISAGQFTFEEYKDQFE